MCLCQASAVLKRMHFVGGTRRKGGLPRVPLMVKATKRRWYMHSNRMGLVLCCCHPWKGFRRNPRSLSRKHMTKPRNRDGTCFTEGKRPIQFWRETNDGKVRIALVNGEDSSVLGNKDITNIPACRCLSVKQAWLDDLVCEASELILTDYHAKRRRSQFASCDELWPVSLLMILVMIKDVVWGE